jgi:predicted nucleic acid-binding protein
MRAFKRLYLDTNVFIALIEGGEEYFADQLASLICEQTTDEPPLFCTSELTLAETLVAPLKAQQNMLIRRYEGTILQSHWLEVVPVARQVLYYSAVIRSQFKLKLPDAIHLSAAYAAGCSHFLTRDSDFQDEYALGHVREGISKPSLPISVLRLNEQTLSALMQSFNND